MNDIYKSAAWSLISIPITMFGIGASFAIAHGSLIFMIPLLAPGLLVLWLLGENNYPEWAVVLLCGTAQYLGYFIVIHGIKKARKYFEHRRAKHT
jgi:uncharacterized membrane protein YfcA